MRTYYNAEINEKLINKTVEICGWVDRKRNHGGLIFLDIRDKTGIVQLVYQPKDIVLIIRTEYVIQAQGVVKLRPQNKYNIKMNSGKIEILTSEINIINTSKSMPFNFHKYNKVSEDLRLKYRYIDLRNPINQNRIIQRSMITKYIRNFLDNKNFLDIETPFLTKSTPEGARDYLVPSRNYKGKFYALPQSPQLFKQLLMISGFDKYYQIVKCFRDEDLRSDRQPEFTQIDIEMSFINEKIIISIIEEMITGLFKNIIGFNFTEKFTIMSYDHAMKNYCSDKPDLRIPLNFIEIKHIFKNETFKIFSIPAHDADSRIVALNIPHGIKTITRKMLDKYKEIVKIHGSQGLAYIKIKNKNLGIKGLNSPLINKISEQSLYEILNITKSNQDDMIFFGAGKKNIVNNSMHALRIQIAEDLNLYTQEWAPVWINNFPMFDDKDGKLSAFHHPFTAPKIEHYDELNNTNCLKKILSHSYDLVINGYEIGSGSIRIHDSRVQQKIFEILGMKQNEINNKFGFLLEALKYGAPLHGGIAFGLDRLTMLITKTNNIRDVIAFPKTQIGNCLVSEAPNKINNEQLNNLSIKIINTDT